MITNVKFVEKTFDTRHKKTQHIKNVHGEMKEFVCNVCDRIFETKGGLNSHIENYHQEGSKNFKYEFCEKFFT